MNRLRVCTVFFAFTVAIAARADETNTPAPAGAPINAAPSGVTGNALPASIVIDGTTYEEVRWERVTPTTVTIFHKTGVATIPLEKLPPELQRRFGYDPVAVRQQLEKVEAEQRALAERKRREEAALPAPKRHLLRIGGIVYDFSELYTAMVEWQRWGSSTEESPQKERAKENFQGCVQRYSDWFIVGDVAQVTSDGLLVKALKLGGEVDANMPLVFVKHCPKQDSMVDGSTCYTVGKVVGRYQYTDTSGGTRTVPAFDCGERVDESEVTGGVAVIQPR